MRQPAHEGGQTVSPMHGCPGPPRKYSWYSFVLEVESIPNHNMSCRIISMKKSNNIIENQIHDLVCNTVHQPIAPPLATTK